LSPCSGKTYSVVPNRQKCLDKSRMINLSRNIIFVLMYHRHKLLDLIPKKYSALGSHLRDYKVQILTRQECGSSPPCKYKIPNILLLSVLM
jgi:hypothetical protein